MKHIFLLTPIEDQKGNSKRRKEIFKKFQVKKVDNSSHLNSHAFTIYLKRR